ncbi:uncharacterized protein [Parasteatoda tepidariorum]|nr:uncharacterized protein LOC107437110 isoform X2 [Parasteatoda tepidariorum]XP_015904492.1 uncharacterized protein LOC107437110 isoform X2 [Parasteatoda tepidariorum]XP_015904494.1 uncharacterized protein LOC107437110 isoform X2 [Parasteatoda tepidariorum]
MKAHPDFKWYKLPTPPARTLVTRPTNRVFQQNEKSSENCGITIGKLVDDEQLGGLSSLINTSVSGTQTADSINLGNSLMAQKGVEIIAKPPKKRYLINGEFQSYAEPPPDDGQDCQLQDACSTLLEFAEICTSNAVRESATIAFSSSEGIPSMTSYDSSTSNHCGFSSNNADSFAKFEETKLEEGSQNLPFTASSQAFRNNVSKSNADFLTQDQPLDLCKNKDKNDISVNSKTITTSHQQLIEHFVDKFLCAKPVPPSNFKSDFLDPVLSKLFSNKSCDVPCTVPSIEPSSFTLSVAIESAVDKAYSSDCVKSPVKVSPNVDTLRSTSFELDTRSKEDCDNIVKPELKQHAKFVEQNCVKLFSSDCKIKDIANSKERNNVLSLNAKVELSKQESIEANIPECSSGSSSSKYFCKLVSPPKKSSVWCNLFMNEQLTKNDSKTTSNISNDSVAGFQSPTRRSSQRTCKGRRYQALITEGLLQSAKERKQNNNKKSVLSNSKLKTKVETIIENHVFGSKKKRKKEGQSKNKSTKIESQAADESLFNLEEKIASLPKCNFEHLNKKKKIILEESMNIEKQKNLNINSTLTHANVQVPSSAISEWTPVSSSGRYKTGTFDLEQQIASLPKCNIELLNKKRKKE